MDRHLRIAVRREVISARRIHEEVASRLAALVGDHAGLSMGGLR
ncbi:hypothetical protein I552_2188 [Mycobacterium xenopi 3993]|nr:hypothetical protein I552_2188 [Mycobacterium xenopi 3993]